MFDADSIELPPWACVGERRRAHIARVTTLLESWAQALGLDAASRAAWRDAGLLHDALRDAPEEELRALVPRVTLPAELLHGPAVAARLARDGERREDMLEAIRWHTVGCATWGAVGRALYMADYLEPGRKFSRADRAYLARQVPRDFDGTFRQVVRHRLEWVLREGHELYPTSVELWNSVR
ncbi:MAG TPA: HD domain-containing protein [Gemmatimonadaceae bacterium]|nr:HD domain-containing protein [Gemmatimonadaceae bacterium]